MSITIIATALMFASCENVVRTIPSGFVGKELTPTGFADEILESGQVDLGATNNNGTSTSLVLLEVTTTTYGRGYTLGLFFTNWRYSPCYLSGLFLIFVGRKSRLNV